MQRFGAQLRCEGRGNWVKVFTEKGGGRDGDGTRYRVRSTRRGDLWTGRGRTSPRERELESSAVREVILVGRA